MDNNTKITPPVKRKLLTPENIRTAFIIGAVITTGAIVVSEIQKQSSNVIVMNISQVSFDDLEDLLDL